MKLINRNQYLDKIVGVMGTPDIKVITGVRRSGKSKLLEAFKGYIEQNVPDSNIIHINFNLPEYDKLLEYRSLYFCEFSLCCRQREHRHDRRGSDVH